MLTCPFGMVGIGALAGAHLGFDLSNALFELGDLSIDRLKFALLFVGELLLCGGG